MPPRGTRGGEPIGHRFDLRQTARKPTIPDSSRTWKHSFLRQPKNQWLCEIPDEFITDDFNQTGLPEVCPRFLQCCDIMVGRIDLGQVLPIVGELQEQLAVAYGLLHARYITSPDGLSRVREKYEDVVYGSCPRLNCLGEPMLPIGLSSSLSSRKDPNPVRAFCPCCREVYNPRTPQTLDGAFFGPNMCHIFIDDLGLKSRKKSYTPYVHTAFGFRVRDEG